MTCYNMSCNGMPYHIMFLHVKWWHILSYDVIPYHFMQCDINLSHVMLWHVMSWYVVSCYVMLCHVMSCHVLSCNFLPCQVISCYLKLAQHAMASLQIKRWWTGFSCLIHSFKRFWHQLRTKTVLIGGLFSEKKCMFQLIYAKMKPYVRFQNFPRLLDLLGLIHAR